MPEGPTPERAQHGELEVQETRKAGVFRAAAISYASSLHKRGAIDATQLMAAEALYRDYETVNGGLKSCLETLDRVDNATDKQIVDLSVYHAKERISALRARIGDTGAFLLEQCVVHGLRPSQVTKQNRHKALGMLQAYLEVTAHHYKLRA